MSEVDTNLRGGLFTNTDKRKDTAPDYKGQCEINGKKFWIAAWVKEGRSRFLSLSFEEFTEADYKKSAEIAAAKAVEKAPVVQGDAPAIDMAAVMAALASNPALLQQLSGAVQQQPAVQTAPAGMQKAPPVYNEPPQDFDDDIPF